MWRAIKRTPMAALVFDMAKQCDYLFGESEGILLFRSVAQILDTDELRIRAPGGTRKIVFLSGTPGNLLKNFKVIVAALHARLAWCQEGHRNQSMEHLLSLGRTMGDEAFCVFLSGLDDVLARDVRPLGKIVQALCEPGPYIRAAQRMLTAIKAKQDRIAELRKLLQVVGLMRQHLNEVEASSFIEAYRPRFVTSFPNLFSSLGPMLQQAPQFQGSKLLVVQSITAANQVVQGPHCQCNARVNYWRMANDDVNLQRNASRVEVPYRGTERTTVRVPLWVWNGRHLNLHKKAVDTTVSSGFDPNLHPEQFHIRSAPRHRREDTPAGLHTLSMFRGHVKNSFSSERRPTVCKHTGPRRRLVKSWTGQRPCTWESRCGVPGKLFALHERIDAALAELSLFLKEVLDEVGGIFGSVGVDTGMGKLLADAASCFNWSDLAFRQPNAAEENNFLNFASGIKPVLTHTKRPSDPKFAVVSQEWPDRQQLLHEYRTLCERVRIALKVADDVTMGLSPSIQLPPEVVARSREWASSARCNCQPGHLERPQSPCSTCKMHFTVKVLHTAVSSAIDMCSWFALGLLQCVYCIRGQSYNVMGPTD